MKKFWYLVIFGIISLVFTATSFAGYEVNSTIKNRIDGLMSVVESQWWSESTIEQINKYEKVIKSFSKVQLNWEQKEMIWYLLYLFENKANELKKNIITQSEVIQNVDWVEVQETILKWHNDERAKKWLNPYTLNTSLNYSALTRAQQIANETRKAGRTHLRNSTDRYYSTDSIKDWFRNLWIHISTFSESNAYWAYKCTKSDCTDEILSVLKKFFNRTFLNSGHYPAVVSKAYDQIWVWVAKNGNWIRLTAHYGVNVN